MLLWNILRLFLNKRYKGTSRPSSALGQPLERDFLMLESLFSEKQWLYFTRKLQLIWLESKVVKEVEIMVLHPFSWRLSNKFCNKRCREKYA